MVSPPRFKRVVRGIDLKIGKTDLSVRWLAHKGLAILPKFTAEFATFYQLSAHPRDTTEKTQARGSMKIKQRTEVSLTTHEVTVVRVRHSAYCPRCRQDTPLLSYAEAVTLLAMTGDELVRMTKIGELHGSVDLNGNTQICGASAAALARDRRAA